MSNQRIKENMITKTIISGSGKNLEGMEWSNLLDDYCPKCDNELTFNNGVHRCEKCGFVITDARFKEVCENLDKDL
jgi:ribosomal protein L37AE/L43A